MAKKEKKPDMFAENKAIMPYGDHVGAPAIRTTDISSYKQKNLIKTLSYFGFERFWIKLENKKNDK